MGNPPFIKVAMQKRIWKSIEEHELSYDIAYMFFCDAQITSRLTPWKYWNIDGLNDMAVALNFIFLQLKKKIKFNVFKSAKFLCWT